MRPIIRQSERAEQIVVVVRYGHGVGQHCSREFELAAHGRRAGVSADELSAHLTFPADTVISICRILSSQVTREC